MNHLPDETINEYLDEALAPDLRIAAETHLAACPSCAARLDELRALFASLESVPEFTPGLDFSALVVARLEKKASLPSTLRWLTGLELAGALLALLLLWPLLQTVLPMQPWVVSTDFLPAWERLLSSWAIPTLRFEPPRLGLDLPVAALTLAVVSAALLWVFGNGILLTSRSRRTS